MVFDICCAVVSTRERKKPPMKSLMLAALPAAALMIGCKEPSNPLDTIPPAPPRSLWTETGDNAVELFWNRNRESDVAGYNVFVSNSYGGPFDLIGSTPSTSFLDLGARNGFTYYYAVTAFDYDGNESSLSVDVAYDVPRPDGYGVVVFNFRQFANTSGYDFSDFTVVPFDDQYADMFLDSDGGVAYMNVRSDTDIQELGPTHSLTDIRVAPSGGWSSTHNVLLRVGHSYAVWTWDDHYAKFRVVALSGNRAVFDWAYQLQPANPSFKPVPAGGRIGELQTENLKN